MPTPEENMQSVRDFAEEVFGRKNLDYAADWLADDFVEHQVFPGTTPDKEGAIDSYRIFFAASPDMTAEIHDMVAAGDKVAIRVTYRGTDQGGFIPKMPATGKPSRWRPCIWSGSTTRDKSPSTGVSSTPSQQWDSSDCFRLSERHRRSARLLERVNEKRSTAKLTKPTRSPTYDYRPRVIYPC